MPHRGVPLPGAAAPSRGTLWPVNLGTTVLPFRRFLETSEPSLVLLRPLQVVGGKVGGSISMESGMRHRKVNQSTRSHYCRCINERYHTASPCYYYRALPHRVRWLSRVMSKDPNICHGRNNWDFAVARRSPETLPINCHNSAYVCGCSPSFNQQPRPRLGESEHHTISSLLTVPCRCHIFSELVAKQGLVHALALSVLPAPSLPKYLLRPVGSNFFGLRFASPAPSCSGRTCHHD